MNYLTVLYDKFQIYISLNNNCADMTRATLLKIIRGHDDYITILTII